MRAIILAAGRGKRMGGLTDHYPKALLPLHGKPLIEWQMQAIQGAGIDTLAIVKGYKAEVFSYPLTYFINQEWEQTNMLSTLFCAHEWLETDDCVVSYSDIVYSKKAIEALLTVKADLAITYDPQWFNLWKLRFEDPLSDAEIFKHKDGLLCDVGGRAAELNEIQGQYMGLLKFSPRGWLKVKSFVQKQPQEVRDKMDMTALLKNLLKEGQQIAVVASEGSWCEVDSVSDYLLCQKIMNLAELSLYA
jgi:choline kinase